MQLTDPQSRKRWNHRVFTPRETMDRLTPVLRRVGITRVADLTRLDRIGIPVFQAVRPMSKLLTVSQGKGLTAGAARVSAVMESIEIWHAENFEPETVQATVAQMQDRRHISPMSYLGPRYDGHPPKGMMPWTGATDLETGDEVLVPLDVVNLDYTRPSEPIWISRNSNGLAGGNTEDEATASALAEVIERGCRRDFAGLNPHQREMRRLDPEVLARDDATVSGLIEMVMQAGLELDLFDMTNGIGVTTVGASLYERHPSRPVDQPSLGHGTHLDPVTAIVRAVTEAAQTRLTHISGNRDDILPGAYKPANLGNLTLGVNNAMGKGAPAGALDLTDQSGSTSAEDVTLMLEAILRAGMGPVICVSLTQPDIGVPVVKVLTPVVSNGTARRKRA